MAGTASLLSNDLGEYEDLMFTILGSAEAGDTRISNEWSRKGSKVTTAKGKEEFLQELGSMMTTLEGISQEDLQSLLRSNPGVKPGVQDLKLLIDQTLSHMNGLHKRIERKPVLVENVGTSLDTPEELVEAGVKSHRSQRALHRFLLQEEMRKTFDKMREDARKTDQPAIPFKKKLVSEREERKAERMRHRKWVREATGVARTTTLVCAIFEGIPFDQKVKDARKAEIINEINDFIESIPQDGNGSRVLTSLIEIADNVVGGYEMGVSEHLDMEDVKDRVIHDCANDEEVREIIGELGRIVQERVLGAFTDMQNEHKAIEEDFQSRMRMSEEIRSNEDYYRRRWDKKRKVSLFESLLIASTRMAADIFPDATEDEQRKTLQERAMEETIFHYAIFEGLSALGVSSIETIGKIKTRLVHTAPEG